jgi:tetratricopeptide (TPR) repeat protein
LYIYLFLLLAAISQQEMSVLQQGLLALQRGDLTEARADLEQAAKTEPLNPYVWSSLAETYLRLKNVGEATSAAKKGEQLGAGNPVIAHALGIFYFHEAEMLLHEEKFSEAADLLATALQKHPDDAQLTLALGVTRYGQRRFDDAIALFLKTIDLQPDAVQPYLFLGKMLDQAGDRLTKITAHFERWAAANPSSGSAQLLLARALLASDPHSPRALDLLRLSIALAPDDWEAHYELGALLESRHAYEASVAELATAVKLAPRQPAPHYHLARVYDRLGKPDQAKAERDIHQALTQPAR